MLADSVHDVLLPELLVQRGDVTSGREHLEDHRVPPRDLLPILGPMLQQVAPGAMHSGGWPGGASEAAAGERGGAEDLQRGEAEAGDVQPRLVLLAEALVLHDLLGAVEAHEEGARRPVAHIAGDVRARPLRGPGGGVHGQAEIDEPEGGMPGNLLRVLTNVEAPAVRAVAQEHVVRVDVPVPRVRRDAVQGGPQLPDQLRRQQDAPPQGRGWVLQRRRWPL
mmetsp:Transcript_124088/g.356332  ORF Transcript_124088/g.356332 Transcript_124088/m.356332 type:complete len:222 (-) Transcript_124088:366-1031(-)